MAWLHVAGATWFGPEVASGRLVLLGGRRAIVTPSGDVLPENARCPEAISEILPAATKAGKPVLVGMGTETLYRFDEPLGAPTPLARLGRGTLAGARGGKVFLRANDAVPCGRPEPCDIVSVDLETGEMVRADASSMPVQAPSPSLPDVELPTLAWIRATYRDPVLAAITNGALLSGGDALALSGTTVATIALPSGRVREIQQLGAPDMGVDGCRAVRAGSRVWVVCTLPDSAGPRTQVYLLSSGSPLVLEPKLSKRHLSPRVLRGSASGALFFYDTDGAVLLTPTGTTALPFPTAATPDGPRRGESPVWFMGDDNILPMSDGRIVFLRVQRMEQQVATLQEGGIEKQIARLPDDWGPFRVVAEDDPGRVKILGWPRHKDPQIATVTVPAGALTMESVSGLACPPDDCNWQIAMSDGRGMAVRVPVGMADTGRRGPETFSLRVADAAITRDGGRTWSKLGVPSAAVASATRTAIPDVGMGGVRATASDVGMVIGRMARLGWAEKDDGAIGEDPPPSAP